MYAFFYSIYMSLFNGVWINRSTDETTQDLQITWNKLTNWLMNLFGGDFTTLQTFSWDIPAQKILALILATITYFIICFAVFGIVKKIFSIFFCGVR